MDTLTKDFAQIKSERDSLLLEKQQLLTVISEENRKIAEVIKHVFEIKTKYVREVESIISERDSRYIKDIEDKIEVVDSYGKKSLLSEDKIEYLEDNEKEKARDVINHVKYN